MAIIGVSIFGLSGLFGPDRKRRQMDGYKEGHPGPDDQAADVEDRIVMTGAGVAALIVSASWTGSGSC